MAKADKFYDGTQVIKTVTNPTTFSYAPATAGSADVKEQPAAGTAKRIKTQLAPIANTSYTISKKKRVLSTATIQTTAAHGFVVGDTVIVSCDDTTFNNGDSPVLVLDVPTTTTFTYTSVGTSIPTLTTATGTAFAVYTNFGVVRYPTHVSSSGTSRTIYFTGDEHGFVKNQFVTVNILGNVAKYNNGGVPVQITSVTDDSFTYTTTGSYTQAYTAAASGSTVLKAAVVSKIPTAFSRTYGEFPNNAGMGGIIYSDNNYSQKEIINAPIIGSALTNVGDMLNKYANSTNGFEYRIDCYVEKVGGINVFKRKFVLIPRTPASLTSYLLANPLDPGEYAPVSAFGADKLTFEYPGNIGDVTLQENSENGVTRMFVVGDSKGSGGDSGARYSAASDNALLDDGWPLLESSEKATWPLVGYNQINLDNWGNFDVEGDLQKTAERFLAESKPPMGEYSIEVNGSLDPAVGSYNPGDWCQLVISDDFISKRLQSSLEPRKNAILRKIESIKVAVPEGPEASEKVTLNLVPEWDIDRHG